MNAIGPNLTCQRKADRVTRASRFSRGYTLTQLLATVLILGVLLAVALPVYTQSKKTAQQRSCEANLSAIFQAEEAYRVRNRTYTSTLSNLTSFLGPTPTCPNGNAAYTVTTSGSGAAQTITVQCNNTGAHIANQFYATSDGATFVGVTPP